MSKYTPGRKVLSRVHTGCAVPCVVVDKCYVPAKISAMGDAVFTGLNLDTTRAISSVRPPLCDTAAIFFHTNTTHAVCTRPNLRTRVMAIFLFTQILGLAALFISEDAPAVSAVLSRGRDGRRAGRSRPFGARRRDRLARHPSRGAGGRCVCVCVCVCERERERERERDMSVNE